jgi:transcriptional regulator with XRE-family HTH domain
MDKEAKKYLKQLGERVLSLRKNKGLTQVQLAERLGTEHAQIGRLERGETNATIIILKRIAKELDVTLGELVNIDNAK